jgi:phasin family protein
MSNKQSYNPFDPMGLMQNFDPMKLMDEFNQQLRRFSMPGLDAGQLLESQRKNLEALMQANQLLLNSTQQLLQRQAELLAQASQEAASTFNSLGGAKPEQLPRSQTELVGAAYGRAIAALNEVTEMMNKAHQEALQVLDKRWKENIEELKAIGAGTSKG